MLGRRYLALGRTEEVVALDDLSKYVRGSLAATASAAGVAGPHPMAGGMTETTLDVHRSDGSIDTSASLDREGRFAAHDAATGQPAGVPGGNGAAGGVASFIAGQGRRQQLTNSEG